MDDYNILCSKRIRFIHTCINVTLLASPFTSTKNNKLFVAIYYVHFASISSSKYNDLRTHKIRIIISHEISIN